MDINTEGVASSSRGLVGDTVFAVLPNIKPIHTFALTIATQSVGGTNSCQYTPLMPHRFG